MRGVIFTVMGDMLEERYGLAFLNDVLVAANLDNGGAYTSGGNYSAEEMERIIDQVRIKQHSSREVVLRDYGEYLSKALAQGFPVMFEQPSLKEFLLSVDKHIHVEVEKLYPNSELPSFQYDDRISDRLVMFYRSSRKMCHMAEGLISGAALHFGEEYSLQHSTCILKGDECCTFELKFDQQ